jgi:hypothetical protein
MTLSSIDDIARFPASYVGGPLGGHGASSIATDGTSREVIMLVG